MPLSLEKPAKVEVAPPAQNQALIIIAIVASVMAFLTIGIILPGRKKKRGSAE
ncbi:MAG: hypothetical protein NXY59_03850 [Aigarchaeota archaeon]|nr:hypothetical protein [Candidatus Pelearchaeum maunauluense]